MAITYNAGTDTITVTAGTAGAPNTFTDIYNADVAGAWGQVTKTGNMFVCDCFVEVGDGSTETHLYDQFKKLTINKAWTVKNNATLKTGIQDGGHPRKGCFLVLNTTSATAITVESGGTFYQYQTLTEDTGTGTNLISGETEDFYRGAMAIGVTGGNTANVIGIGGLPDDTQVSRVFESITCNFVLSRYDACTLLWKTYLSILPGMSAFLDVHPGIGYQYTGNTAHCLIIDNLVDGEFYDAVFTCASNKYRFDIPAGGGGGLMRNPPMTGGTV